MKRNKVEDRIDEIEDRINKRQGYHTLDQDDADALWLIIIIRTLLEGREIS